MPTITIVGANGTRYRVSASTDDTLMESARHGGVEEITAECGGACACATCHVYVDDGWMSRIGPPNPSEQGMLDALDNARAASRLACQITVVESFDGLVVRIPVREGAP